jgi:glycosyltransferase involved in cell wall biosynthesis
LDIEGGYGGSSRSLYESVFHLDRSQAAVEVWCRKAGPIQDKYRDIGIPCRVVPQIPRVSSLPLLSRNLYVFGHAVVDHWRARRLMADMSDEINVRFDLVHFNHEALFLLARSLRSRVHVPFSMHLRTNLHPSLFARWQYKVIGQTIDSRVFITSNEAKTYSRLGGIGSGHVIFNIVRPVEAVAPLEVIPDDGRFRIACLSNYSWLRGTDQLIAVAEALARRNRTDVLFVIGGDNRLTRGMPGELGRLAARGRALADYAEQHGVGQYFLFLGHVAKPEQLIAGCHALIKPTREDNPWGRDILEAAAQSRLVITIGHDKTFIEDGRTGLLFPSFDAEQLASAIARFSDNRADAAALGAAARGRVLSLCDGISRAADLLKVWKETRRDR